MGQGGLRFASALALAESGGSKWQGRGIAQSAQAKRGRLGKPLAMREGRHPLAESQPIFDRKTPLDSRLEGVLILSFKCLSRWTSIEIKIAAKGTIGF